MADASYSSASSASSAEIVSDHVVVPLSNGSDSPVVVPHDSSSSASSMGLSETIQSVAIGGTEPVITVIASDKGVSQSHAVIALDASGSMEGIFLDTLEAIRQQISDAHKQETSVTLLVFQGSTVTRVDYPPGMPFVPGHFSCGGGTPLFDALSMAFSIVSDLPAKVRGLIFVRTDGMENTSSSTNNYQLREQYRTLRQKKDMKLFMVSSAPDALALASFLEMGRDHVLALTGEDKRHHALCAAKRVMTDCITSTSLSDVCFSEQDRFSSEGPSHHHRQSQPSSNGSGYVVLDGTHYPGVTAADLQNGHDDHDNGNFGPSDQVWSECPY